MSLNYTPHDITLLVNGQKQNLPAVDKQKPIVVKHKPLVEIGNYGGVVIYEPPEFIGLGNMPYTDDHIFHPDLIVAEKTASYFWQFAPWYRGRIFATNTNPGHALRDERNVVCGCDSLLEFKKPETK